MKKFVWLVWEKPVEGEPERAPAYIELDNPSELGEWLNALMTLEGKEVHRSKQEIRSRLEGITVERVELL